MTSFWQSHPPAGTATRTRHFVLFSTRKIYDRVASGQDTIMAPEGTAIWLGRSR